MAAGGQGRLAFCAGLVKNAGVKYRINIIQDQSEQTAMKTTADVILPGATIGVLGSGQLGRMFAIAARRMGYRVHTFSPDTDTPTGQVADEEITAAYDDLDAVREFARRVSVVTFEFENVLSATVAAAAEFAPVRPGWRVLHTAQHRLREKTFLQQHGFPVTPFKTVNTLEDLQAGLRGFGCPAVLKTAGFGYDGKGQTKLNAPEEAAAAFADAGTQELVLEAFVDFACELSVVAARGVDGAFAHWGAVENAHSHHILDVTIAPARVSSEIAARAVEITRAVLEQLEVVGVLCVEFFLTRDGQLLINELAPRPHNSGHFTFDACVTSPVRTAIARGLRLAPGFDTLVETGGDGQFAGRSVAARRTGLGGGLRLSRCQIASVRETGPQAGPQNGPSDCLGGDGGRGCGVGADGAGGVGTGACLSLESAALQKGEPPIIIPAYSSSHFLVF
jgi:5-(carboxyamino)imidazole ribonucleotide synthase